VADLLCPVVVGRDAELEVLDARLDAALRGRGGCVVLTGEAGIGKSRLVRHVVVEAGEKGVPVATGRAVPSGASGPYRPLTEALLQALRGRPFPDDPSLAPWLPALGAIVPGVGGSGGGGPSGDTSAAVRDGLASHGRGDADGHTLRHGWHGHAWVYPCRRGGL